MAEILKGVIENVVYINADNDYCVIEVVDENNDLITAVGTMPMPFDGENVTLVGEYGMHKEFGRQFAFESFEKTLPEEEEGILQYLSSKTVKGIGPVTAHKIVKKFGCDTFEIIENHPEWLADIPGITLKKAAVISESFREQSALRNVMMFCKDYMDKSDVTKIYKNLGAEAVSVIKDNPYILCNEVYGISFDKTDALAKDLGVDLSSYERICAGILYTLSYNASYNGHTCLPYEKLGLAAASVLGLDVEVIYDTIMQMISDGLLAKYICDGEALVMRSYVKDAEEYIAKRIVEMERYTSHFTKADIQAMIEKVEDLYGIRYAELQKEAIYMAMSGSLTILTGGPGTGKTTVVKGLISIFKSIGHKCVLSAPTGRAAKRLSEATGEEAKTIHRLLEMERVSDDTPKFNRDAMNPLDENVVIVDEASMLDLDITYALFRAIKRGSRLILIGDTDQLPSVGAGNILADMISSKRITTVFLTEIFRQSKESLIITNAHRINKGEDPVLSDTKSDFFFVRRDREATIPDAIAELIDERLPKKYGARIREQIQVISPSKKGDGGVIALNSTLQEKLNPKQSFKKEIKLHATLFREGDKVMQTVNNYDIEWEKNGAVGTGIFNGDIGFIERIDTVEESIVITFDDRRATYTYDMASELELAYAITVHKSQGSEYPVVIIPSFQCAPMLLTRNLLYTAVTRAKKMVIMVGRPDIPSRMVANNVEVLRYTTLGVRIANL